MPDRRQTELVQATEADAELLSNLLELYIYDLSVAFPSVELGANGRFGYSKLARYWSEPESHFPFLLRQATRIVGFALVTRGSPASEDPEVFDVAEFFILRRYRRTGVGRQAAALLWTRFPGKWSVRVSEANPGALPFWSRVIGDYAPGNAQESKRAGKPHDWRVFSFVTTP